MKLNYSDIHRENEVLEDSLQEHLEHISWNERKALAEKGEELDEIRMQLLEITELQAAVNSRQPGDTSNVVSDIRNFRYNRDTDVAHLTKTNRARMRLEAERDKFSSKNLFNVSRGNKSLKIDFGTPAKLMTPPETQIKVDKEDRVQWHGEDTSNETENEEKQASQWTTSSVKNTSPPQCNFRSRSAHADYRREGKAHTVLPPRPTTVPRSRSRRELEKISRLIPEHERTINLKVDWNVISRTTRHQKLQQLKAGEQNLQCKIRHFMKELDRLNKGSQLTKMTP